MANVKVSKELRDEVSKNQDSFSMGLNLQPSDTVLLLNGMYFDIDITDMSTILDSITQELNIMEGLYSIGNLMLNNLPNVFNIQVLKLFVFL